MDQDTDHRTEANPRNPLRHPSPELGWEGEFRKRKPRSPAAAAPKTLTSQMLDYRSWWNLPGPKARKTHG